MNIPKSFKLLGQTITVEYADNLVQHNDTQGEARYRFNRIVLQRSVDGCQRTTEQIERTFLHELTHWVLLFMGEDKLDNNEKFVDLMAGLLHQAITSFEYGDGPLDQAKP